MEWTVSHAAENNFPGVIFHDWCVNSATDKCNYGPSFEMLQRTLSTPEAVVFVHCKSGRDRSPFTVYALLRITYSVNEEEARALLAHRVGTHGRPIANLDEQFKTNAMWLDEVLGEV